MQKETLNKIEMLDAQQKQLVSSLKIDCQAMLSYIDKLVSPAKEKAVVASR